MPGRNADALTTIQLRKATRDRLKQFGGKGETYDEILNRMMDRIAAAATPTRKPPPRGLVDFEPLD
jgi:hypothetical protein